MLPTLCEQSYPPWKPAPVGRGLRIVLMPMETAMLATVVRSAQFMLTLTKNLSSAIMAPLFSRDAAWHSVRTLASSMQMIGQLVFESFADLYKASMALYPANDSIYSLVLWRILPLES